MEAYIGSYVVRGNDPSSETAWDHNHEIRG